MHEQHEWREQELNGREYDGHTSPYGYPFRTCKWDGSIHPDDLHEYLKKQGHAPVFDFHSKPEPLEGEGYDEAYLRWMKNQYDYKGGIRLNESDWKYGWPHKFYVEGIPNPLAGKPVCSSISSSGHTHRQEKGPAFAHAKFYTKHLVDASDFEGLAALLEEQIPNIHWEKDEGGVKWSGLRSPGVY